MKNKIMKSSIASLLIASTIFISDIHTVTQAEEPESDITSEAAVTNEDIQMQNTQEEPAESTEEPASEEPTPEEDVLVSSTPDSSDEEQVRNAAIEAHRQNDETNEAGSAVHESQESGTSDERSSEQPTPPTIETDEENTIAPELTEDMTDEPVTEEVPAEEPVTEEVPTTEPETGEAPTEESIVETPTSEETTEEAIEETNQPPTAEVPVQDDGGPVTDEPVMEPVEPSAEAPASGSETDDSGFVPYPEEENVHTSPETSEAPAAEKKRYFRYDYGNILEGIMLRPGASEADLDLLDKRVNRLISTRIVESSEVDEEYIYEIEEKVKNEEGVTASTTRENLPDTGEANYTFLYGTVLFISGVILLFIMRKPKHNK